jgi:hypothetical protein
MQKTFIYFSDYRYSVGEQDGFPYDFDLRTEALSQVLLPVMPEQTNE